jgi:hypothetical protein
MLSQGPWLSFSVSEHRTGASGMCSCSSRRNVAQPSRADELVTRSLRRRVPPPDCELAGMFASRLHEVGLTRHRLMLEARVGSWADCVVSSSSSARSPAVCRWLWSTTRSRRSGRGRRQTTRCPEHDQTECAHFMRPASRLDTHRLALWAATTRWRPSAPSDSLATFRRVRYGADEADTRGEAMSDYCAARQVVSRP